MCKEKFNSPQHYREWSRRLDREWNQALPSGEFSVVRFVFDRTAGWGKQWEVITLSHFTDCVIGKNGVNYGGIHAKQNGTVLAYIRSLVEKGAILREPKGKSFIYSINYDWTPPMKMPKSKRAIKKFEERMANVCDNRTDDVCENRTGDSAIIAHKENKKERGKKNKEGDKSLPSLKAEIEKGQDKVRERSRLTRNSQKREGYFLKDSKGFVPTERAFRKIWEDTHNEHFEGQMCHSLSKRSINALRAYCREWGGRNSKDEFVYDFLPWVFRNWRTLMKTQFSWMSDSPEIPAPFFLSNAKLRSHFESAWQDRKEIDRMASLSPKEREVEWLKKKGVSPEAAEKISSEIDKNSEILEKIKKAKRAIPARRKRAFKIAKKSSQCISRAVRPKSSDARTNLESLPDWDE